MDVPQKVAEQMNDNTVDLIIRYRIRDGAINIEAMPIDSLVLCKIKCVLDAQVMKLLDASYVPSKPMKKIISPFAIFKR